MRPRRGGWRGFDADAERLAAAFWPGPLTLVLPKAAGCPVAELATAGLDSIAVRVPRHRGGAQLLLAFGRPVVAPSANRSGHVSPTTAAHVLADLRGRIDLIVDGGPTPVGVEFDHRRLPRRAGAAAAGRPAARGDRARARAAARRRAGSRAPRQTMRRSRPACSRRTTRRARRLRLDARASKPAKRCLPSGLSAGRAQSAPRACSTFRRAAISIEAAANLFSHLRALDAAGAPRIAVMPVPHEGLGEAINDRLVRAAAPRPARL